VVNMRSTVFLASLGSTDFSGNRSVACRSESGPMTRPAKKSTRGHAIVELALMMPWIFFLFVAALDFGFQAHALIGVQNAARVAALKTGAVYDNYVQALIDPTLTERIVACAAVRDELQMMPNFATLPVDCSGFPLEVRVRPFTDSGGKPALRVSVGYDTIPLIPIPGLVTGQLRITRVADVRVFGDM